MKTKQVSANEIRDLADKVQKSLTVPVEYIQGALEMVNNEGCIDLHRAEMIDVRKLVRARLAEARRRFEQSQKDIGTEVDAMFYRLNHGSFAQRMSEALPSA